jgi:hypothetical protein
MKTPATLYTARQALEKTFGVRVQKRSKYGLAGTGFHYLAGVHHRHLIRHFSHDTQIMGNEQNGRAALGLEVLDKPQYAGLDGYIEGCSRLIGYQQVGFEAQGHGDHHPLLHTAGKLMGVLSHPLARGGNPDLGQIFQGNLFGLPLAHSGMDAHGLHYLPADGEDGVQAGHGFLEDHRGQAASDVAQLNLGKGDYFPA